MVREMAFFLGIYLWGVVVSWICWRKLPIALRLSSSLFWGLAGWVAAALLIMGAGCGYTLGKMQAVFGVSALLFLWVEWRRDAKSLRREVTGALIGATCVAVVTWCAWRLNLSVVSYDSIPQLMIAQEIGSAGSLEGVQGMLASWGSLYVIVNSASVLIGRPYWVALQPLVGVGFLSVFCAIAFHALCRVQTTRALALFVSLMAGLSLASTYFIVFQFFYIHNNLFSAAYFLLGVGGLWLRLAGEDESTERFGMAALTAYAFCRVEAPLFAALVIAWYAAEGAKASRAWRLLSAGYALIIVSWYGWLANSIGAGTDILTPSRAILLACVTLAAVLASYGSSAVAQIARWRIRSMPGVLVLALVAMAGMFLKRPEAMTQSLIGMLGNMGVAGRWCWTWWVLGAMLIGSFRTPAFVAGRMLAGVSLGGLCLLYGLAYLRVPYHLGWPDSANRIATQFVPLLMLFLVVLTCAKRQGDAAMRDCSRNSNMA